MDAPQPNASTTTTGLLYLLAVILPLILIPAAMVFSSKNKFPVEGRTVIITGGSQGMGLAVAKLLASKGANIAIVARDERKLAAALSEIQASAASPSQRFLTLSYDLTAEASAPALLAEVISWNNSHAPDIVWNCAGYCLPGFFADAPISTHREEMEVCYWSCAYLAHAVLNLWKQPPPPPPSAPHTLPSPHTTPLPPPRHLVFTSSLNALFPVAGYAPYTTAKAAMRFLADTLQHEVALYNGAARSKTLAAHEKPSAEIRIHTIYPMGITSPGFENENKLKPEITCLLEETDQPQTPEEVAAAAVKGLEKGERMVATNLLGRLTVGAGLGAGMRDGLMDVVWQWIGSIAVIFVAWDFLNKGEKWGREKGLRTGPKAKADV